MDESDIILLSSVRGVAFTGVTSRNLLAYAASVYFFVLEGLCVGLWGLCIPYMHSALDLSDSEVGAAAFCTFLGVFSGAPLTGLLMVQFGVQRAILTAGILYGIILPFLVSAPDFGTLIPIMYSFGLLWGIVDTSANNAVVVCEMVDGKSRIGSCYGAYSIAAGLCAFVGGFIITSGTTIRTLLIATSVLASLCTIVFANVLYTLKQEEHIQQSHLQRMRIQDGAVAAAKQDTDEVTIELSHIQSNKATRKHSIREASTSKSGQSTYSPIQHAPDEIAQAIERESNSELEPSSRSCCTCCAFSKSSLLVFLCCLGFLSTFGEAAMVTWIIIYYEEVLHTRDDVKSAGFACFMIANAVGRFASDYLRTRYSRNKIIFGAGTLVSVGMWLIFAVSFTKNALVPTTLGFVLTALGLSTLTPMVMSCAGRQTDAQNSGTAVATAAACTYFGSIVSSPIMGVISDASGSLRYGMLFVTLMLALIIPISVLIPPEAVIREEHSHTPLSVDSRHNNATDDV